MRSLRSAGLFFLGILIVVAPAFSADLRTLEIASRNGVHVFAVELATTEAEREKGLMFRTDLPEGQGMLFDFQREQDVAMWMRNTYISLDMLFIKSDGRVLKIATETEPLSTKIIPSGGPVRGVLEIRGGTSRKLGIAAGDRVAFPIFRAN